MNLLNFIKDFPNEDSCKLKFKEIRDKQGIICPHCGSKEHYWKRDKWQYECKSCKYRTTLRSGTVMHGSKLPFRYWFVAMHLLTSTKKSFSAQEVQRQLGHKRYQPIWTMLHKLRQAMGNRDEQYQLSGAIELDEGFFSTEVAEKDKDRPLKRGRGSQKKTKVLVMTESKKVEGKTTKKGKPRKVGFIKMKVISDLKAGTITPIVKKSISKQSEILTDDSTSYVDLKNVVDNHKPQVIPKEKTGELLPWATLPLVMPNECYWISIMILSLSSYRII